ncbi:18079_t:CDS:2 [Cetraspora pellucida]|uniref:18079_t:CDS:1 n=1 Tax=Cetraspora pellucida TaxID=1433469 RepID=A0ACA9K493_9GLOM|nr:18079_t:CDS:2 [Cetraspora pellucida]
MVLAKYIACLLIAPAAVIIIFDLVYFAIGSALNTIIKIGTRIKEHTRRGHTRRIDNVPSTAIKEAILK